MHQVQLDMVNPMKNHGAGVIDPGSVDPGSVDPGSVDPGSVDPGSVDPGSVDPGSVDPGSVDPPGKGSDRTRNDRFTGMLRGLVFRSHDWDYHHR